MRSIGCHRHAVRSPVEAVDGVSGGVRPIGSGLGSDEGLGGTVPCAMRTGPTPHSVDVLGRTPDDSCSARGDPRKGRSEIGAAVDAVADTLHATDEERFAIL